MKVGDRIRYTPTMLATQDLPADGVITDYMPAGDIFRMHMLVMSGIEHWLPAHECALLTGSEPPLETVPCLLRTPLSSLEFAPQTLKLLKQLGISTLDELRRTPRDTLLNTKGFGNITMFEIRHKLGELGLSLQGDTIPDTNEGVIAYYRPRRVLQRAHSQSRLQEKPMGRPDDTEETTSPAPAAHQSDCSTNNAPAMPVGPCDCSATPAPAATETPAADAPAQPPIEAIAPGCTPNVGPDGTVYPAPASETTD